MAHTMLIKSRVFVNSTEKSQPLFTIVGAKNSSKNGSNLLLASIEQAALTDTQYVQGAGPA